MKFYRIFLNFFLIIIILLVKFTNRHFSLNHIVKRILIEKKEMNHYRYKYHQIRMSAYKTPYRGTLKFFEKI